jgi:hypothetical protein
MFGLHALGKVPALGQQGQAAMHGALGVVFARGLGAEGGQQAVTRVLQHAAAVFGHHAGAAAQQAVHQFVDLLRVQALGQPGRTHHVQEQHRHLAQGLRTRRGLDLQLRQPFAQRAERGFDHGVAQQGALRFEGSDGCPQRLGIFGRHGWRFITVRLALAPCPSAVFRSVWNLSARWRG